MVFLHGGAFTEGSGNDDVNGPERFPREKDVILVTLNYRLGVLGFLNFNETKHSGNMALKDQQLALKWIHKNIAQFLGDNKRITLFGESAGSTMTHLHMMSSESRKYFNNAIAFSGVTQNPWSMSQTSDHLKLVNQIAQDFAISPTPVDALIESIKALPAENISGYGDVYQLIKRTEFGTLSPLVESKLTKLFLFETFESKKEFLYLLDSFRK